MAVSADIFILNMLNTVCSRRLLFRIVCFHACALVDKIILLGYIFKLSSSLSMEESSYISVVGAVLLLLDRLSVTTIFSSSLSRQWYIFLA